jgi:diguanylate cyclase (GGDEF)-like protein
MIIIGMVGVLGLTLALSLYITRFIGQYSVLINDSGKVRGGIQRTVKLALMGEAYASVSDEIDGYLTKIKTFESSKRFLIKKPNEGDLIILQNQWNQLKILLHEYDAKKGPSVEFNNLSEEIWVQANIVVTGIENSFHSYIKYYTVIAIVLFSSIIILALISFAIKYFIQQRVEVQASHDYLTGLFNRNYFDIFLKKQLHESNRNNQNVAIMLCDIDHFKNVNDTYGHDTGDKVLKAIAETFMMTSRASDTIIRFGGEEFLIIASYQNIDDLMRYAERIRMNIENTKILDLNITISIGIAICDHSGEVNKVIKKADTALYTAKENGRNQVILYDNIKK